MVNEKKWAIALFLFAVVLFSRKYEDRLTVFEVVVHNFAILLLMSILVYPPDEFITGVGLNLNQMANSLVEPTHMKSIQYLCSKIILHKTYFRSVPTVILGYFLHGNLCYYGIESRFPDILNHSMITAVLFAISVIYSIWFYYSIRDYKKWKFYEFFEEDESILKTVEQQMFAFETVRLDLSRQNGTTVFFTENYFVHSSNWNIAVARINDIKITVNQSIIPPIHDGDENDSIQSLVLVVSFDQSYLDPVYFTIRENVFREVQSLTGVAITIAEHIELQPTEMEKRVMEFSERVKHNEKYVNSRREKEPCFACGSLENQVKLSTSCHNRNQRVIINDEGVAIPQEPCTNCACPPYWCLSCMGKIFITKQKTSNNNQWLDGSANCPTCRRAFCITDVHIVDYSEERQVE